MKILLLFGIGLSMIELSYQQHKECLPTEYSAYDCSCVDDNIVCQNVSSWPTLNNPKRFNSLHISNSPGLRLHNNTFQNLEVILLNLSHNNWNEINILPAAFADLTVKNLDLSYNRLSSIPEAVYSIGNLEGLSVSGNGIPDFRWPAGINKIMKKLGRTLLRFSFGSPDIDIWPEALKYFLHLQELNVTRCDFMLMPPRAFYGFEKTLKKLRIEDTSIRSVPPALGTLDYLEELHFDHNIRVGDYGMNISMVNNSLKHLYYITLKDDNITTFPLILGNFTSLCKLEMGHNNFEFVSDKAALAIKNVTNLSLTDSKISRIPEALQDMTTLQQIDLSNNGIHSIEKEDLENLTSLETLILNNNPIRYISNHAFQNSYELKFLRLENTNLTEIPCAIKKLPIHKYNLFLDLSKNRIDCTCSLRWLLDWAEGRRCKLSIDGECLTVNSNIQDFIDNTLGSCPTSTLCNQVESSPDSTTSSSCNKSNMMKCPQS